MMRNYLELTDRVAVVIGATSGIGRTMALGLACHGANVVPTGRRSEAVEADTALPVPLGGVAEMVASFEQAYRQHFSFLMRDKTIFVEAVSVELVAASAAPAWRGRSGADKL